MTFEKIVFQLQDDVRNELGKNLTLDGVQKMIDKSKDKQVAMFGFAMLLSNSKIKKKKTWNKLGRLFFVANFLEMTAYCAAFDPSLPKNAKSRIIVRDPDRLIEILALLKKEKIIENCSYDQLATTILATFPMNYVVGTVSNKLKMSKWE